jgi:hypothetical protein
VLLQLLAPRQMLPRLEMLVALLHEVLPLLLALAVAGRLAML